MNRLSEVAVAGLLTAGVLASAGCAEYSDPAPQIASTASPYTIEQPPVTAPRICPAPSEASLQAVEELFTSTPLERTDPYAHQYYVDKQQNIVARLGLKMPNSELVRTIDTLENKNRPYSDYYDTANQFFGELAITLSVAKPDELSQGTANVPSDAQLDSHASKYQIREVVDGISYLPTQFIEFSGLKKVILAANTGDYAYTIVGENHDTMVVDVANLDFAADLGNHEVYHLVDRQECGSYEAMLNDPAFVALNQGKDIYAKDAQGNNIGEVTNSNAIPQELHQEMLDAVNAHDQVAACTAKAAIDEKHAKVMANTNYALTNPAEDKAETGKMFAFGSIYYEALDPAVQIVRSKFLFLMARLYDHLPNVVKFFAATSSRPADGPFNVEC